jgi:hypothetical protein
VDGDGLSDIVGASAPSTVAGFGSFWWIRGQLGAQTLRAPVTQVWPFRLPEQYASILWQFMVRAGQPESALVVSNQVLFEEQFSVVPFHRTGLNVAAREYRKEGHGGLFSRSFEALGDFDGDGYDELLERGYPDVGGYSFRIFAGSKSGNGVGQLMTEWFTWGNSGDLAPDEEAIWLYLY